MASKRRLRRKACTGKLRHLSAAAAMSHIHSLFRRKGWQGQLNAYHCPHCGGWHVGHTPRHA